MNKKKEQLLRNELSVFYSELDLHVLLSKIAAKIREYLNCEASSIFLYNPLKEELYFEVATGDKEQELKKVILKKGEGIVGWVAEHERPLIINDCANDPRFTSRIDLKTRFTTRAIVGVPVHRDNRLLGVMEAINKISGQFDEQDSEMLQYFSRFVAIPLENAMLFKKITRETREKDRLLELAKTISYSNNLEDVLARLKEIICDIISPTEINVLVHSDERKHIYHLLERHESSSPHRPVEETAIGNDTAMFPLKSQKRSLGFLELKVEKRVPQEVVSLIRGLAAFVAILIEKLEFQARMIEKEKIEKELEIARNIQQYFLPKGPFQIRGVDVAFVNIPSSAVGGDYFDIIPLDDNQTILSINDVSGHGIPASLLMSIFRTNFVYRVKRDNDMAETLGHLNRLIVETTETNHFVTSFTCRLDMEKMNLQYIDAGHNPPFILRDDEIIKLSEGSLPVGMMGDVSYTTSEIEIRPGDILTMYTDGIIEAENAAGEQYGFDQLIAFIKEHRNDYAEDIKEFLVKELKRYSGDDHFEDDVTLILVKILD